MSPPGSAEGILAPEAVDRQENPEIHPQPGIPGEGAGGGALQVRLSCGVTLPLLSSDPFAPEPFDGLLKDSAVLAPPPGDGPFWLPRGQAAAPGGGLTL